MKQLILASASPRRKQLLERVGVKFKIVESNFKEVKPDGMSPYKLAMMNAEGKARQVARRVKNAIVIGGDSIVYVNNTILEKPKDKDDAKRMLKMLSGTSHQVYTGYCLVDSESNKIVTNYVAGTVYFKKLSKEEIDAYVKTGEPMDKAGAYAIQGIGGLFVKKVEGDFLGIVGLPLYPLYIELKKLGISLLSF